MWCKGPIERPGFLLHAVIASCLFCLVLWQKSDGLWAWDVWRRGPTRHGSTKQAPSPLFCSVLACSGAPTKPTRFVCFLPAQAARPGSQQWAGRSETRPMTSPPGPAAPAWVRGEGHQIKRLGERLPRVSEATFVDCDVPLHDEVHPPPPVPELVSLHRTGIDQGRRRRSSLSSRPLLPRSLPLRSTSRGRGEDRGDGGTQTGSNEVLCFDHIAR